MFGNIIDNNGNVLITNTNSRIVGRTELQIKTLITNSIIRFIFNFTQAFYFRYLVTEEGKRLVSNTNNTLTGRFVIIDIIRDKLLNTNKIIKNYTNTILHKYYYNITNLNVELIVNNLLTRYKLLNTQSIIRVTKNIILSTYRHLINKITITQKFNSILGGYKYLLTVINTKVNFHSKLKRVFAFFKSIIIRYRGE